MTYVQKPGPMERARDVIAARIEQRHPGWKVSHGLYGWTATRAGYPEVRCKSYNGFSGDIARASRPAARGAGRSAG